MSRHKRSVERQCEYCGKKFMAYPQGKQTARFCSRSCARLNWSPETETKVAESHRKKMVEKICLQCGKVFYIRSAGQTSANRKFCSQKCSAIYRFKGTELGREYARRMRQSGNGWEGTKRPDVAERMIKHNPMANLETRERARKSKLGQTFLSRGGNGTVTKQQEQLRQALGLLEDTLEYPVLTAKAAAEFPSLPPCYKVDLAIPELKLAIEVDGRTHKEKRWRYLDQRKTAVLNHLGWTVLRFWNKEIDQDLNRCVQMVMSTILRLKETITTSPTEYSSTTATNSSQNHRIGEWLSTSW